MHSLATSIRVLLSGPRSDHWGVPEGIAPVSRLRALTEALLSVTSLLVQVVLPFSVSLYFALRDL